MGSSRETGRGASTAAKHQSVFDPQVAANLHPGQPVDVEFKSK
jgi:hypothetical protein